MPKGFFCLAIVALSIMLSFGGCSERAPHSIVDTKLSCVEFRNSVVKIDGRNIAVSSPICVR